MTCLVPTPSLSPAALARALGFVLLALAIMLALTACSDTIGRDKPDGALSPFGVDSPLAGQENFSFLRQNGTIWMNEQDQKVSLRGINLGNWLTMEIWMFDQSGTALGTPAVPDQCTVEDTLTERFGAEEKDRLLEVFWRSWITESDWDTMKEAGFNVIRVPFLYNMIENDSKPMTLLGDVAAHEPAPVPESGDVRDYLDNPFRYLDWSIEQAKKRNMYIILDLHGAPGRQGTEHHSGCEGVNMLWGSQEFRARTVWLWQQLATRYRDEHAVASYGLLNEPWGTDSETLRDFLVELTQAIRTIDKRHIVMLHGHNDDGINAYGDPKADYGLDNVAFEIHAYPGLFGQGEIGYIEHRNWLTCGPEGVTGMCQDAIIARNAYTPMLVGETQPWTSLGPLGGPITRATFDRYNEMNWAVTAWSYKTTSLSGGLGSGPWGLITNEGSQLLAKADTWGCNDWESTFADACSAQAKAVTPHNEEGMQTMYLVVKTGAQGSVDVTYDDIQLTDNETGQNLLSGSAFGPGSDTGWNFLQISGAGAEDAYDYNYTDAGVFAGSDSGPGLRINLEAGTNSMIYQTVEIVGGRTYTLSGKFRENTRAESHEGTWAEVYLVPDQPKEGVDVLGQVLPKVSIFSSSVAEIENFFASFATMPYVRNHWVFDALKAEEPADLFVNIPTPPTGVSLADYQVDDSTNMATATLRWDQHPQSVSGYRVFQSTSPRTNFMQMAEYTAGQDRVYVANNLDSSRTYYYFVTAFNETDVSYQSATVSTGRTVFPVPGQIQAEDFVRSHPGVVTEPARDTGGGSNIGHFEPGRFVDYQIDVQQAGDYDIDLRLASLVGDVRFRFSIGDESTVGSEYLRKEDGEINVITVPNTGGWQAYITMTTTLSLPVGEQYLRLESIDNQWNLNWFRLRPSGSGGGGGGGGAEAPPDPRPRIDVEIPQTLTSGSSAAASLVNNEAKGKDVISLTAMDGGNSRTSHAGFSFTAVDARSFDSLEFDVFDAAGPSTFRVSLVDSSGASAVVVTPNQTGSRSVTGAWARVGVDLSLVDGLIDLANVVSVTVGVSLAGEYLLSDFAFHDTGLRLDITKGLRDGSSAIAGYVPDATKGFDVIELQVEATNNIGESYAGLSFPALNVSGSTSLRFDVLDSQGANTVNVKLIDAAGSEWSAWTSDSDAEKTVLGQWKTIGLDVAPAASVVNLGQLTEIRVAMYHLGTYLLSDFSFFGAGSALLDAMIGPDIRPQLRLPTPTASVVSRPNAAGTNVVASVVNDATKSKDVISYQKTGAGQLDSLYLSYGIASAMGDVSAYDLLAFDVLSSVRGQTVSLALVDGAGVVCRASTPNSAAGRTVADEWTRVSLELGAIAQGSCSPANSTLDLTSLSEIRLAQEAAGSYRYSDFAFVQSGTRLANPTAVSTGSAAMAELTNDPTMGPNVISYTKNASDSIADGYVSFTFGNFNAARFSLFQVDVLDTQGSNTLHITLVDANGDTWSLWTDGNNARGRSVQNVWTTLELPIAAAAGSIDLTMLRELRLTQWNIGRYLFTNYRWFAAPGLDLPVRDGPERRPVLRLLNPVEVMGVDDKTTDTITVSASVVADTVKGKDVILFEKAGGADAFGEHYVAFSFGRTLDLSSFSAVNFDVFDMSVPTDPNTVHLSLVDGDGTVCGEWTADDAKPVRATWSTLALGLNHCHTNNQFDMSSVVGMRLSEWHPGVYRFSDFAFVQSGTLITNPTVVSSGSAATARLVDAPGNSGKVSSSKVISLTRAASGTIAEGYAAFSFSAMDFSSFNQIQFEVLDQEGSNTAQLTLLDADGMSWVATTPTAAAERTIVGAWTTLQVDISSVTGIDAARVTGIRVAFADAGNYQISDFRLFSVPTPPTAPMLSYAGSAVDATQDSALSPNISFANAGGAITQCFADQALPAGLTINSSSCEISGTPTASQGATTYTITARNITGSSTAMVSIAVSAAAPALPALTGNDTNSELAIGEAITPIVLANSGGDAASCAESSADSASLLSAIGLEVAVLERAGMADTCQITGVPGIGAESAVYRVQAGNVTGMHTAAVRLSVAGFAPSRARLLALDNPSAVSGGSVATASVVNNQAKGKNVISLAVTTASSLDQAFASFSVPSADYSGYNGLAFDVLDMTGANALSLTLEDSEENSATAATSTMTVAGEWARLSVSLSGISGVDLAKLASLSVASAVAETYLLSDFAFTQDGTALANPSSVSAGSNSIATATVVSDALKGIDVISYSKLANQLGMVDAGYAQFDVSETDLSTFHLLEFDVYDSQGVDAQNPAGSPGNNVRVALVDDDGDSCQAWTSAADARRARRDVWTTLALGLGFATTASSADCTTDSGGTDGSFTGSKLSAIRVSERNPGDYRFSDFVLLIYPDIAVDNPADGNALADGRASCPAQTPNCPTGEASVAMDSTKSKDVIKYIKTESGGVDDAYASFSLGGLDLSSHSRLSIDVLDTQGTSQVNLALVDSSGEVWSLTSTASAVQDTWTTVTVDLSAASDSIDLGDVSHIRLAQDAAGTYYYSDLVFGN